MSAGDAALMEASLLAVADSGIEIRHGIFDRFFEAYPETRDRFLNIETTSQQMTEETLEMLYGLAKEESWVWSRIADLVYEHQSYGDPGFGEYAGFVDLLIDEVRKAVGDSWTLECESAWKRQAAKLEAMIDEAIVQWAEAMPQSGGLRSGSTD